MLITGLLVVGLPAGSAAALEPDDPPILGVEGEVIDGPNAGSTTTVQAGDTIRWKVTYDNVPSSDGDGAQITAPIGDGLSYVPGSLDVPGAGEPGGWTPTTSTVPGSADPDDYVPGPEPTGVQGVGMTHPTNGYPTAVGGTAAFSAPGSGFQASTAGGDGTYAIFWGGNVYNVHHHRLQGQGTLMECHVKATGAVCPGWSAAGNNFSSVAGSPIGAGDSYTGSWYPGEYLDRATGRLYLPVQTTNTADKLNRVGIACIDLAQNQSCGYTNLVSDANSTVQLAQWSGNARVGTRLYGVDSDTRMFCWDQTTNTMCPGYPKMLHTGGALPAFTNLGFFPVESFGNYVFAGAPLTNGRRDFFCIDTTTDAPCPGFPKLNQPSPTPIAGTIRFIMPLTTSTGAVRGACYQTSSGSNVVQWDCFDLSGAPVTPPSWSSLPTGTAMGYDGYGSPLLQGTKVWSHRNNAAGISTYTCHDYAIDAPCAGFTPYSSGAVMKSYSIREDPENPGCLWSVGDVGRFEVFTAATGAPGCAISTARLTVTPTDYYCDGDPAHIDGYDQLVLHDLAASAYGGARLTLRSGGTAIADWTNRDVTAELKATGAVDIGSVSASTYPDLEVALSFSAIDGSPFTADDEPSVTLMWDGDPLEMCFETTVDDVCDLAEVALEPQLAFLPAREPRRVTTAAASFDYLATSASCFTLSKTVQSVSDLGDNTHRVRYVITVGHPGPSRAIYDLEDEFDFGPDAQPVGEPSVFTDPAGLPLVGSWTGVAPDTQLVDDAIIGPSGTHRYTVDVSVHVPIGAEPADTECDTFPGTGTSVVNAATLTSTTGSRSADACADVPAVPADPSLTLLKSVDRPQVPGSGEDVVYTFEVRNSGNVAVTDVVVDEVAFSGSGSLSAVTCPDTSLEPGESVECTAGYTTTAADTEAGRVTNTAVARADSAFGEVESNEDDALVTIPRTPGLTLQKSVDRPQVDAAGDTVVYTFRVRNTGNVVITGLVIDEVEFTGAGDLSAVSCADTTLDPGETVDCTASYTLTVEDADAGRVENTAIARGGSVVGPVASNEDDALVTIPSGPGLRLQKSVDRPQVPDSGEDLVYTFEVQNVGNVTLTGIAVDEVAFTGSGTLSAVTCPDTDVAPGESVECTATYTTTTADTDAGRIDNTAIARGTSPSGTVESNEDDAVVTIPRTPALVLQKSVDRPQVFRSGEDLVYTFEVRNVGNITITDLAVDEVAFTGSGELSEVRCEATQLAPGERTECTADYTTTVPDADAGRIDNTAIARGGSSTGPVESNEDDALVTIPQETALALQKSVDRAEVPGSGEDLVYTFAVQNVGNVTVTDLVIDELAFTGSGELTAIRCERSSLAPGDTVNCTASYRTTVPDADAGRVDNSAVARGTSPAGPVDSNEDDAEVTIPSASGLALEKSVDRTRITGSGQRLVYTFLVRNTGNVTISNLAIEEVAFSGTGELSAVVCAATTLPPGGATACTATYRTTAADRDAGKITNTAVALGTTVGGPIRSNEDRAVVIVIDPSGGSSSGGGVERLPFTGAEARLLPLVGAAAVLAGLVLLALRRRDRRVER